MATTEPATATADPAIVEIGRKQLKSYRNHFSGALGMEGSAVFSGSRFRSAFSGSALLWSPFIHTTPAFVAPRLRPEDDAVAIGEDWAAVGQDLWYALQVVLQESPEEKVRVGAALLTYAESRFRQHAGDPAEQLPLDFGAWPDRGHLE